MALTSDTVQLRLDIETQQGVREYQKLLDQNKQLTNGMRRLKRAGKENTDEYRAMAKEADMVRKNLQKLGGAGASLGQLRTRAKQLRSELSGLVPGTKAYQAVNEELSQVLGTVSSRGKSNIEVFKTLKTALKGIIILELLNFLSQMVGLVGQSSRELTKLRGEVQRFTAATGEDLDNYTTRIDALSKTFGDSTDEVLIAANALTKQLTGDFNESLQLIEKGYLSGANAGGDFLDQVKEYPAFFREAGLSGEQMISIISQSVNEGVFSDKGADLIKEFNLRIRELPKSTKEALTAIGTDSEAIGKIIEEEGVGGAFIEVQKRLNGLKDDSPVVGQALADIFGGPGEDAGIQFIKNLDLTGEALNELVDVGNEYTQQLQEQYDANLELSEAQNEVSKRLTDTQNSLSVYVTRAKTLFFSLTSQVLEFFENLPATGAGIKAAFQQVGTNIGNFFKQLFLDVKILFTEAEKFNPLGRTNELINADLAQLRKSRKEIREETRSIFEAYNEAYLDGRERAKVRKAAAAALTPPLAKADIKQAAQKTVRSYGEAVDEELEKLKAERANDKPVELLVKPISAAFEGPATLESNGQGGIADLEREQSVLQQRFLQNLITEREYEDQRFLLQQELYDRRLAFLQQKFGEESKAYIDLENEKLEAQRRYEGERASLTERTEQYRADLLQEGLKGASAFLQTTLDLLGQEENERKKNAGLLKTFALGKIAVDTQEAIMGIIKNAESNPGNILFPGLGGIITGVKVAGVLAKSAVAVRKVRKQGFFRGGMTGRRGYYRDAQGEVAGVVHTNEWVAPAWMKDHPQYGQHINWLESMRQRGFSEGGFTSTPTPAPVVTNTTTTINQGVDNTREMERLVARIEQSNMRVEKAIQRKQFSVPASSVRDSINELDRLEQQAGF
ncbi:MAG: phage tail tape measure protein [Bacteroidota bacterium]